MMIGTARRLAMAGILIAAGLTMACGEESTPPAVTQGNKQLDSAEQVMFGVRHVLTSKGVQQAELHSDTALFFDESTRIELKKVDLTFFRTTGAKDARLTSREGTYNTRLQMMEARGTVIVQSEDGKRLTTSQLRYDQGRDEIRTDSAFVLTQPGQRMEGIGFISDPNVTRFSCLRACRGSPGQVNLPQEGQTPAAAPATRTDSAGQPRPGSRPGTFRLP